MRFISLISVQRSTAQSHNGIVRVSKYIMGIFFILGLPLPDLCWFDTDQYFQREDRNYDKG